MFFFPMNNLNFFHETLDLIDDLVSVGLIDVGTEADLPVPILRYWSDTEHGDGEKDQLTDTADQLSSLVFYASVASHSVSRGLGARETPRPGYLFNCCQFCVSG